MTENTNEPVDSTAESDEVDVEPFEGDPDFQVPPSQQHQGLDESQDDDSVTDENEIDEEVGGKVTSPAPGLSVGDAVEPAKHRDDTDA